jgi:glycosyltransferase involved in cell wall biosynthesis
VVGDDDSHDDTVAIIQREFEQARVTEPTLSTELVIHRHQPPLGVVGNFANTLLACRGDLIALSDQDDIWAPEKLARIAPLFGADLRLLLAHTDASLVDSVGSPLRHSLLDALGANKSELKGLAHGDAFRVLMRRNLVTGATVLIRRSLVVQAHPFPREWMHDEWLAVLAAAQGEHALRLLPERLIEYRQHGGNLIGAARPTITELWQRLREPRHLRATLLAQRTHMLVERLVWLGVPDDRVAVARYKNEHEVRRRDLPRYRIARIPGIFLSLLIGRYHRYSRGALDVLRDLMQPAGKER